VEKLAFGESSLGGLHANTRLAPMASDGRHDHRGMDGGLFVEAAASGWILDLPCEQRLVGNLGIRHFCLCAYCVAVFSGRDEYSRRSQE
jgi:hypothetical protein